MEPCTNKACPRNFDSILTSYDELASTALLTLHLEIRTRILHSLQTALSPLTTAPYLLDQEVNEPDPEILSLNSEMVAYDEVLVRCLRQREVRFVRNGLGKLINGFLIKNAPMTAPMNAKGCGRMQLNILVLQQNLKNIEEGVDLVRASNYFEMFERGVDAILEKAREDVASSHDATGADGAGRKSEDAGEGTETPNSRKSAEIFGDDKDRFSYDELKALVELCYSEQLADPERGVAAAAKRQMADKLLNLSEYMWQS